jgi:hypothetical protein
MPGVRLEERRAGPRVKKESVAGCLKIQPWWLVFFGKKKKRKKTHRSAAPLALLQSDADAAPPAGS